MIRQVTTDWCNCNTIGHRRWCYFFFHIILYVTANGRKASAQICNLITGNTKWHSIGRRGNFMVSIGRSSES